MRALKEDAPEGTMGLIVAEGILVHYFRRTPPRFHPQTWNVREATLQDRQRTNNMCESLNNSFKHLVGHNNPSLWTILGCLPKDAAMSEAAILRYEEGQPESKRVRKSAANHQKRVKNLCQQHEREEKTMAQFLIAMGQCI
ncbi:hypothetical protein MAR_016124, partial [Mya arenaria]